MTSLCNIVFSYHQLFIFFFFFFDHLYNKSHLINNRFKLFLILKKSTHFNSLLFQKIDSRNLMIKIKDIIRGPKSHMPRQTWIPHPKPCHIVSTQIQCKKMLSLCNRAFWKQISTKPKNYDLYQGPSSLLQKK